MEIKDSAEDSSRSKLTDVPKSRFLQRLKIRHKLQADVVDLASPISVQQLDLNFLFLAFIARIRSLIVAIKFSNVILVLNFLHCFHIVVCTGDIEQRYLRFLQEVGGRIMSRWDQAIIVELEDFLLIRKTKQC